jgi:hypothetical protein
MNYAVSTPRYDNSYLRNLYGALSIEGQKGLSDLEPAAGYEYLLRNLAGPYGSLSAAHDLALRRMYDIFRSRYTADVLSNPTENSGKSWLDWLSDQDYDYELARLPMQARGINYSRWFRPARYVAF